MSKARGRLMGTVIALIAGVMIGPAPANAADYYAGKTIDIIVGGAAAGGIDIYARLVGRHLHRHIPGNPNVVVKNRKKVLPNLNKRKWS